MVFVRLPVEISIGDFANPLSRTRDARRFRHDRVIAPYGGRSIFIRNIYHINDFSERGRPADMETFKGLKTREALIEFEMVEGREGKPRAVRAVEFVWSPMH